MKKLLLILLAALLLLSYGCAAFAEADLEEIVEDETLEPMPESFYPLERRILGDWYADFEGLALTLSLSEDGGYALLVPGQAAREGAWELLDGYVTLDDGEGGTLLPVDGVLYWDGPGLLFTRELPETYVPAEAVSDAQAGDFDGYWKSQFIAVGEGTVFASAVGDKTDVYIDGTSVALGGPLFGDVLVGMELRDGTLYYEAGSVSVTLTLQRDGFLRLTLSGENSVTLYLFPAVPKALPEG